MNMNPNKESVMKIVVSRDDRAVLGIFQSIDKDGWVVYNDWEEGTREAEPTEDVDVVDGHISYRGPGGLKEGKAS